jgi:hypothetical protein
LGFAQGFHPVKADSTQVQVKRHVNCVTQVVILSDPLELFQRLTIWQVIQAFV